MLLRKIFSFPTLTLIVALTLSAIAAWYSILGLTAIFAAAVIPIIIMGGSLEVAKVVTTVWLHRYWDRAGWLLKMYLIPAVVALAFLTSMGIFGFLSKAHSDQELVSGDVGAKVAVYDEKIKTARDNIDANRKALQQMDAQVDQLLGRTTDDKGANRAVQVRRQQRAERNRLQNEIAADQEVIGKLNEEAAPIRAQIRKVEAEVGPIKYIAALIYGDQVQDDTTTLEKAVRWVIILIVFVFDPLALSLVIAAQHSYRWLDDDLRNRRKEKDSKENEDVPTTRLPQDDVSEFNYGVGETPQSEPVPDPVALEPILEEVKEEVEFIEAFLNTKLDEDTSKFLDENLDDMLHETAYDDPKEDNNVSEPIQPDTIQPDVVVREDVPEILAPDAVSAGDSVEQSEASESREEPAAVIKTEGVTLHQGEGGYIQFEGKSMSKAALQGMHPELFARPDTGHQSTTKFGVEFPKFADKGDIFVRVDVLPNRVYKFDGFKWIEINKDSTDSYLFDDQYVNYLVGKIETGEYDVELLSDNEKEQIADYIQRNQK